VFSAYKLLVRHRVDRNSLLNQPVEQFATVLAGPTIESERELVKVIIEMLKTYSPLMSTQQPPFEKRSHAMDAREQIRWRFLATCKKRDPMAVSSLANAFIAEPCVCVHYATRLYRFFDEGLQAVGGRIRNPAHSNPSDSSLPNLFDRNHDQGSLFQIPPTLAFNTRSPVRFVDLDVPRQSFSPRANHRPTELVEPSPGGSVGRQAQYALQSQSTGTSFLTGYPPNGSEPRGQRHTGILKDAASGHRGLPSAGRALKEACPDWPRLAVTAFRAFEAIGPPQPVEVRAAGLLSRKVGFKFSQSSGIFFHTQAHYILGLP
jgi:hypothetical protein